MTGAAGQWRRRAGAGGGTSRAETADKSRWVGGQREQQRLTGLVVPVGLGVLGRSSAAGLSRWCSSRPASLLPPPPSEQHLPGCHPPPIGVVFAPGAHSPRSFSISTLTPIHAHARPHAPHRAMGTVTLMPAVPPSPVHHAHAMYADDANNHVLREDGPALARPVAQRPPVHAPSAFAPPAHASPSVGADPYVAIREMLWLLPGISEIVKNTLERMEKAFAYNSVFFLKSVLDLQSTYLTIRPRPEPAVVLDTTLVLRIAETLSGRLTRREKDVASPSRELQLRTLISALTLLYQRDEGKLDNDTYAKLLRDVSERDAENGAKHHQKAYENKFRTGENEFLTRYACDLIRCMPSDIDPLFEDLNSETIHFIFAAGFIVRSPIGRIPSPVADWHAEPVGRSVEPQNR